MHSSAIIICKPPVNWQSHHCDHWLLNKRHDWSSSIFSFPGSRQQRCAHDEYEPLMGSNEKKNQTHLQSKANNHPFESLVNTENQHLTHDNFKEIAFFSLFVTVEQLWTVRNALLLTLTGRRSIPTDTLHLQKYNNPKKMARTKKALHSDSIEFIATKLMHTK